MKVVRKISRSTNAEIGRHIIITRKTTQGYFARNVGEKSEYWLAENLDNFREIPCMICKLNLNEFEYLKTGVVISLSLEGIRNKQRKIIAERKPPLIKFWHPRKGCIFIKPACIKTRIIDRKPYVYIEVCNRCFEGPEEGGVIP